MANRKQFIIYAIIGVSGAILDYLAFIAMIRWIPLHYLAINAISTTLGVTNNFFLNAHFNFAVKDRIFKRFIAFFAVGLLGMVIASGLLYLLIDILHFIPEVSKLLIIIVIVLLQYNLNRKLSFKRS
ncbi:MAG: GtrA family protein [Verrucomicrobiota bacterium]